MADDTKARLLDAAIEVFGEKGYQGAGVAEIARRADLTTGAIYSQYRGKADLLLEALTARIPQELERLLSSNDAPSEVTSILATLGSDLLVGDDQGDGLMLETFAAARREPDLADRLRHRLADEERQMAKLVDEAKADGVFDEALDTDAVVRFCHSVGLGMFLSRSLGLPMPDPQNWQLVIDRVIASAMPAESSASSSLESSVSTSTSSTSTSSNAQAGSTDSAAISLVEDSGASL